MPFLIIIIPAFWAMYLVATLVEIPLAAVLSFLPLSVALLVHDYATPLALLGFILALFGNYCQLSEILINRNTARDIIFMFAGSLIVLMVFITLPDWPLVVGRSAFAALTLFCPAAVFGRAIMDRTETAFSTIALALLCTTGLAAATWLLKF